MTQNWQTGYFWNQKGQEALHFQFELTETTLKFRPYVARLKKTLGARRTVVTQPRDLKFYMRGTIPNWILN